MLATKISSLGLAVLVIGTPSLAFADKTLTLVVGGEGFGGPPRFAVAFDGKPVGEAAVQAAIDTRSAGRFADAANQASYVQTFSFPIPDAVFKPDGIVSIKLTNAAHGDPGSKDERELFVRSVAIDGTILPASSLSMRSAAGVEPTSLLGNYMVISRNEVEGIALPSGGWATSAASAEVAVPAAATHQVAEAPPTDPVKTGAIVSDAPAALDTADANPNPEGGAAQCGINQKFQVTGFSRNSNELTPIARKDLDAVAKAIGAQKCVVHLTGYSSTEGDVAHNALFSIERSQNALHYLAARGVKFRRYSANGVGETTQFGPSPDANRRVVVSVSP